MLLLSPDSSTLATQHNPGQLVPFLTCCVCLTGTPAAQHAEPAEPPLQNGGPSASPGQNGHAQPAEPTDTASLDAGKPHSASLCCCLSGKCTCLQLCMQTYQQLRLLP